MSTQALTADSGEMIRGESGELQQTRAMALAQHEIQSAILIAKKFPRNEDQAFQSLMRTCQRTSFAANGYYSFKRGKKKNEQTGKWEDNIVSGAAVGIAREAARVWQNIRYGFEITHDSPDERTVRGYAWDVETNTKVEQDDTFKKLIQRFVGGQTEWVVPDERDLRELTNKRGAIAQRNCITQILPKDLVEEAVATCRETLLRDAAQDPDELRKKLAFGFGELNITVVMLEQYLGHPLVQCTPAELTELRGVWKSIADGNTFWADYAQPASGDKVAEATGRSVDALKSKYVPGNATPATDGAAPVDAAKVGTQPNPTEPAPEMEQAQPASASKQRR